MIKFDTVIFFFVMSIKIITKICVNISITLFFGNFRMQKNIKINHQHG